MKGEIVGVKCVSFTNKTTGEVIQGTRLYIIANDIECFGKSCSEVWVGGGTPLENHLANYLRFPEKMVGLECDFSFKPNSRSVQQFDIIDVIDAKKAS